MMDPERDAWLKGLKAGDEVAVDVSWYGRGMYVIRKVDRITATGRVTVDGRQFINGSSKGSSGYSWRSIGPVTAEVRDSIARRRALEAIGRACREADGIPTGALVAAAKLLNSQAEKEES